MSSHTNVTNSLRKRGKDKGRRNKRNRSSIEDLNQNEQDERDLDLMEEDEFRSKECCKVWNCTEVNNEAYEIYRNAQKKTWAENKPVVAALMLFNLKWFPATPDHGKIRAIMINEKPFCFVCISLIFGVTILTLNKYMKRVRESGFNYITFEHRNTGKFNYNKYLIQILK